MKGGVFNAFALYRLGRWFYIRKIPAIPRLCEVLNYLLFKSIVPMSAEIGEGSFCSHRGIAVVLHRQCTVGKNTVIGTCVTLGGRDDNSPGGPTVGSNVYVGTGAKILGPVKVGDGAKIGANAVVLEDVPDGCTAVGVPAKIIKRK